MPSMPSVAFLTFSGISSSPSRKKACWADFTAAAALASSSSSRSFRPHVQSLHARRRLTGLPLGSGKTQSGWILSSGVSNDRPPSARRGASNAQTADLAARSDVPRLSLSDRSGTDVDGVDVGRRTVGELGDVYATMSDDGVGR